MEYDHKVKEFPCLDNYHTPKFLEFSMQMAVQISINFNSLRFFSILLSKLKSDFSVKIFLLGAKLSTILKLIYPLTCWNRSCCLKHYTHISSAFNNELDKFNGFVLLNIFVKCSYSLLFQTYHGAFKSVYSTVFWNFCILLLRQCLIRNANNFNRKHTETKTLNSTRVLIS